MRKNHQQYRNTTYIDGFAVLFFDGMSKERKKYKRTKCNLWRTGKLQKKYKNTNCIFGRNGKIPKKQKYKVYFFCISFVFFRIFFVFLQKIMRKNTKKYECNCSKIQNTKKIRINNFKNTKYKKIRTQNFKNTKYKEKTNSKISQRANPVFTLGNQEPKYKKNTKPTSCIFQNPAVLILYFLGCIFFVFFLVFLNVGRRPLCSHRGQLNLSWGDEQQPRNHRRSCNPGTFSRRLAEKKLVTVLVFGSEDPARWWCREDWSTWSWYRFIAGVNISCVRDFIAYL